MHTTIHHVWIWPILIMTCTATWGLQVYDCDGPNTTYKVISMLKPEACPDPAKDYEDPRTSMEDQGQGFGGPNLTVEACGLVSNIDCDCRYTWTPQHSIGY